MTNTLPKFLVTRFAPGAGGNFISSILQCSKSVGHWHTKIEEDKENTNWLNFFQSHFVHPLNEWTSNEPLATRDWGVKDIFSATYPRGNDLSISDYLKEEQEKTNMGFKKAKDQGKLLPVFWHKEFIPQYFNNSVGLSIFLDKRSLRWFDHSIYLKHHSIIKTNHDKSVVVHLEQHRPTYQVATFDNQYEVTYGSFKEFVKDRIINNHHRKLFQDSDFINNFPNKNIIIELSDLLNWNRLQDTYDKLCIFYNIEDPLDVKELEELFRHWRDLHEY